MSANISCPFCQRLLVVPEEYHGGEVRCPACQQVFVSGKSTGITDISARSPLPKAPPATSALRPGQPPAEEEEFLFPTRPHQEWDDDEDQEDRPASGRRFRSASSLALAAKLLLGLELFFSLALLGSSYLQYDLAKRVIAAANVPDAEVNRLELIQMVLGVLQFGVYLATVVVFVCWFYRAHANLEPLGARYLTYTSGWAAGCWFVPILNLFRPVQIAQEIWRHSDPYVTDEPGGPLAASKSSALIGFWWGVWLISNVIHNVSFRISLDVNSPESLKTAAVVEMVAEVASAIAAILALAVVASIDARQTGRAEMLRLFDTEA